MKRCVWAMTPAMIEYHDKEWGVPTHDDKKIFEFLVLETAQAGLSWAVVLKKRENYRKAFDAFNPAKIARYTQKDIRRLLANPGIIRNKAKILATINNAQRFLDIQKEFRSFDRYIWQFVDGQPIKNKFKKPSEIPPKTTLSDIISEDLKNRGFKFLGSTVCYAHMQATGMVNDHTTDCFRYKEV